MSNFILTGATPEDGGRPEHASSRPNASVPSLEELNQRLYVTKRQLRGLTERAADFDQQILQLRQQIERNRHLSTSISFLLGKLLIESGRSPAALARLPAGLLELVRLSRTRKMIRRAKLLLEANGFRVTRTHAPVNAPLPHASDRIQAPSKDAARLRRIYEELRDIAAAIPESNGSQYHQPLDLCVAIVTDEFMFNYYRSIFREIVYLTPQNYVEKMDRHDIGLFLYVSCWSGLNHDEWRGINYRERTKSALLDIIARARAKGVPTVFQTIEDPSNYEHYLPVARNFDHIFTTDVDCVERYRRDTDAKTVHYGEYGVNPLFNNPIGSRRRVHAGAFFAGSYPSRYPERCHDMHVLFDSLVQSGVDLVIADRNSDKPSATVAFPQRYGSKLVPKLEHGLLQKVHKTFKYNLNFNSIKNSPTMCAMRVYELQAQGSLVLSNYAKSVLNNFPNIDIVNAQVGMGSYVNDVDELALYEKGVAGIRNVMTAKTGFDQTARMLKRIGLRMPEPQVQTVTVIARELTPSIQAMFERQHYPHKRLVSTGALPASALMGYFAFFAPENDYEPNYLVDMVNAFKYTNSKYVTKVAFFDNSGLHDGPQHEFVSEIPSVWRTVFDAKHFAPSEVLAWPERQPCDGGYALDPFELNYDRYLESCKQPMSEYALSVVVPVYNNGTFLRYKCLESLRRNALFPRMEILLVDDGSTDPITLSTVEQLRRRFANVRVFTFADGGSGSASRPRNKGVELASAPLVAFLDPDNEISPNGYDRLHALYLEEKQAGRPLDFVAGYQIKVASKQTVTAKHTDDRMTVYDDPRNTFLLKRRFPIVSTQAAVIDRDFLLRSGVDFVLNAVGQDTLYGHELVACATRVGFTSEAHIVYYADRTDSVTNTLNLKFFQKSLILEKAQRDRFYARGLLDEYVQNKFHNFFEGWYLEKLKVADPTIRRAAENILNDILRLYGVQPMDFEGRLQNK